MVAAGASAQAAGMAGVLEHIPNLNISVPVNIDKWDAATYAPLVLFIPADFDEKTYTQPLKAYDKDGGVHLLDAKHAPDYPVVVVGPSERVRGTALTSEAFSAKGSPNKKKPAKPNRLLPIDDPNYPGDPLPPTPTPPSNPPQYYATCRTDKQTEYLRSLWMKDISEYEDWVLGGPEIRLQILAPLGATGNNGATIYDGTFMMSRGAITDTWYCDLDLYYWEKATTSDAVKYVWLEQDWGDIATEEVTLEYSFPHGPKVTSKLTFKIGNADDMIGTKTMNFELCPSAGYYALNGGSSEFQWSLQNRP